MMTVAFLDFWDDFVPEDNFLIEALRKVSDVEVVDANRVEPDILFYSIFGYAHLKHMAPLRIYYTGENDVPDFNFCDYAISFHHINFGPRHLRLPLYTHWPSYRLLRSGRRMPLPKEERGFCSFVVSNNFCATPLRTQIFERLSAYKPVASGGRWGNNVGGPVKDKLAFLNQYKFNIAFENSQVHGYTTEKIFDALAARTIPIYWGNPANDFDVPRGCYINISDFASLDDAIAYIKAVDADPELYASILAQNPIESSPYLQWEQMLEQWFAAIVGNPRRHITFYGLGGMNAKNALEKEQLFDSHMLRRLLKYYKKLKS